MRPLVLVYLKYEIPNLRYDIREYSVNKKFESKRYFLAYKVVELIYLITSQLTQRHLSLSLPPSVRWEMSHFMEKTFYVVKFQLVKSDNYRNMSNENLYFF